MPTHMKTHHAKRSLISMGIFYAAGALSLLWLILRSGSKPSRLGYPCQQVAAAQALSLFTGLLPWLGSTSLVMRLHHIPDKSELPHPSRFSAAKVITALIVLSPIFLFQLTGEAESSSRLTAAASLTAGELRSVQLPPPPPQNPTVAIIHRDHVPDEAEIAVMVDEAIRSALGSGGLANIIASGDTVLIKPNLGCGYQEHETANWQVVKPIVQLARQAGAGQIWIGEGEGCGYGMMALFADSGYTANITDVTYVDFNDIQTNPTYAVEVEDGLWSEAIAIPQVYFDADVVVTVPVLKTHNDAGVTIGLKNAFGVPPASIYSDGPTWRTLFHSLYEVRKTIVQINLAKQPDLAIVDALLAGEGQGPWESDPVVMNTILAGRDLVALDAVGASLMGIDPERIPYLVYAAYKNLGILDLEAVQVVGTPIEAIRREFALPAEAAWIYRKATVIERSAAPLMIDGATEDWYSVEAIQLAETEIITGRVNWSGTADLAVEGRFLNDGEALYALLEVNDDQRLINPSPGEPEAQGDSLDLYLSLVEPWSRLGTPEYGAEDFHLRVGYQTNPSLWDVGRGVMLPEAQAVLVDTPDGYLIELRIPFSTLGQFAAVENKQIGLDLSAIDLDDGQAGKTQMNWSGGTDLPTDARWMGAALLGMERAPGSPPRAYFYLPIIQMGVWP